MKVSCRASGRTVVLIAGIRHQYWTETRLELPRMNSSRFELWQCHERHIRHSTRRRIGTAVGSLRVSGERSSFGEEFRFRTTEESLKFPGERVHLAPRSRAVTTRFVSSVVLKKRTAKSDPKERSLWHLRR